MGVKFSALLGLLFVCLTALPVCSEPLETPIQEPIQERMKGWRLRIRHPDPRYLSTKEDLPKVDNNEHVVEGRPYRFFLIGRGSWRPDPSAQVDEIRARLADEARKR